MGKVGMIREVDITKEKIETAEFRYAHVGPAMIHNYLCAVCREEKAVLETWHGILQPCWKCQRDRGWKLVKLNWLDRLFKRGMA